MERCVVRSYTILREVLGSLPFDVVLTGGCAAGLLACSAWVLGTSALVAVTHLATLVAPGSPALSACVRLAEAACPGIARGAVVGVLGLGLGAAVAGPALADASGTSPSGTTALDGLTVPDRATGLARPAPRVLQVRPGDSLWSIASRLLPRGADDARISEAWHTLHRANRTRVGDDPDLIQPGTRLVVPDLTAPHREDHP